MGKAAQRRRGFHRRKTGGWTEDTKTWTQGIHCTPEGAHSNGGCGSQRGSVPTSLLASWLPHCSFCTVGDISDHTTYNLPRGPHPEDRAGRGELPTAHPGGARQPGGRTYGLLGVHPQACQVVTKEGDLVFGARCQGEVGAAGPRLQTHKTAGDKLSAQLDGPRLDGERRGSLITQVNRVGYIWKHTQKTGVKNGSAAPREMGTMRANTSHGWGTREIFLNMRATSQSR